MRGIWVGLLGIVAGAGCAPVNAARVVDPGPPHPIIEHVEQQEVLTPLPLRVRLPASYGAQYVLALVRT
jgi:hypothetical protein